MTTKAAPRPAISPKSLDFLIVLVRERQNAKGLDETESLAEVTKWLAGPRTQREVSDMIDRLKAQPKRMVTKPIAEVLAAAPARPAYVPFPTVPASVPRAKYALLTELLVEAPESWRKQSHLFFEVKNLSRGRTVIKRLLGAPGAFTRTGVPAALQVELLGHLEKPEFAFQASKTFGELFTCCGRCAAPLTDDLSRERQFGPVCWPLMPHSAAV